MAIKTPSNLSEMVIGHFKTGSLVVQIRQSQIRMQTLSPSPYTSTLIELNELRTLV